MERLNGKVKQLQQEIRNLNGEIEDKEQKVGDSNFQAISLRSEPVHDKIYKMACTPSEDSDQPGHLPSLCCAHIR